MSAESHTVSDPSADELRDAWLRADVGAAMLATGELPALLGACTGPIGRRFGASCGVWLLDQAENEVARVAGAGPIAARLGEGLLGRIADERRALEGPEGPASMVGWPLLADGRLLGVLAVLSPRALPANALDAGAPVADLLARGIARKQAELALEEAARTKDQFLGILSHELRTPLNAIQGFGSALEDGLMGPLTGEQAHGVGKILDASDAMLALVDDLLDMSRVQAGKIQLTIAAVDVSDLVRDALGSLQALAATRRQRLVSHLPAQIPAIAGDALRVSQVVTNLVTNAIKFTPEGGTIAVGAVLQPGHLRLEVSDTGMGIAEADRARIFQPFTQIGGGATRRKSGVGLGLAIVKALVQAHGGEVGVESVEGLGATFWFTLPLAP